MKNVSQHRVHLGVDEARALAQAALGRMGLDAEEARIVADHVLEAALCGYEYSGLAKILNIPESPRFGRPRTPMRLARETTVSALYDGGNNLGMVTLFRATQVAIAKASEHGFAVVGVNDSWLSGRSAHYVEMVARAGLVGFLAVSSNRRVAPSGGMAPAIGTNPVAFGFPTAGEPLVIDLSTSAMSFSDVILRARRGEPLAEGVAIDAQGKPTRDAALAALGALLPFGGELGGHKGAALALAMQALGVLAGSGGDGGRLDGYLVVALKPDLLVPLEDYRRELCEALARIKATPRLPGVEEIRIPSERAFRERARCLREGIEIDLEVYEALKKL